jgi:hypothetical protein
VVGWSPLIERLRELETAVGWLAGGWRRGWAVLLFVQPSNTSHAFTTNHHQSPPVTTTTTTTTYHHHHCHHEPTSSSFLFSISKLLDPNKRFLKVVMDGFLDLKLRPWQRASVTRLAALGPSIAIAVLTSDHAPTRNAINEWLNILQSIQVERK